jgi:hypothetical protein
MNIDVVAYGESATVVSAFCGATCQELGTAGQAG